MCKTSIILQ